MKGNMVITTRIPRKSSMNTNMNTQGKADTHISMNTGQQLC